MFSLISSLTLSEGGLPDIRRTPIFVLVFVISLPQVVYSAHYFLLSEKFVLYIKGWLKTSPAG